MNGKPPAGPPLPTTSMTTQPFWDAAARDELVLQWDPACGRHQFWPRPVSIFNIASDVEWRRSPGRGRLAQRTLVRQPIRGFENIQPFILVVAELDEGVRIGGRLINCSWDEARPGMRLILGWERLGPSSVFYVFKPEAPAGEPNTKETGL